jgi:hypothetical protein
MAAIQLDTPILREAQPAKTFNEVWLADLTIKSRPNQAAMVDATLLPCRTAEDGSKECDWINRKTVVVDDFFAVATTEELSLMYQLVAALKSRANI